MYAKLVRAIQASEMSTVLCRMCGNRLETDKLFELGKHLFNDHPDIEILHFYYEDDDGDGIRPGDDNDPNAQQIEFVAEPEIVPETKSSERLSLKVKSSFKTAIEKINKGRQRWLGSEAYKTCVSVENWRPGQNVITCKHCGKSMPPLIRHRKNKITNNPIGALFLLTCWPICFLPIVLGGKSEILVCCGNCGYCFGDYDIQTGKITPLEKDIKLELPNICNVKF